MGVDGLWDVLRPVAQPRSHHHLAVVDGFEANTDGVRGFRIGIDTSLWFYHAESGREGESPELRTLFFRCARLLNKPFLPVFVFEGPKRPAVKRGKRIDQTRHWLVDGMKTIIAAFGFEWRMAPGEAEAELAYLNSVGQIDAVLSDDVDTFLFGATMVVRNTSNTLSCNIARPVLNAEGRDDGEHSHIYKASDIRHHGSIQLTRGGMILIGLLSGGDYSDGVKGCGMKTAHALARCGFGDELLMAVQKHTPEALPGYLSLWNVRLREELRTNSRGLLEKKMPKLSREWPQWFPNLDVLRLYTDPVTSKTDASARVTHIPLEWKKEPDFGKIAHVCELYFEWGFEDIIIKRFRTLLWNGAIQRILRRAVLQDDARRRGEQTSIEQQTSPAGVDYIGAPFALVKQFFSEEEVRRPESVLVERIHASRTHASTDHLLEYRLSILPETLIHICTAGLRHSRPLIDTTFDVPPPNPGDEDEMGKKCVPREIVDPLTPLRVWVPASVISIVRPDLVEHFEEAQARKAPARTGAGEAARAARQKAVSAGAAGKDELPIAGTSKSIKSFFTAMKPRDLPAKDKRRAIPVTTGRVLDLTVPRPPDVTRQPLRVITGAVTSASKPQEATRRRPSILESLDHAFSEDHTYYPTTTSTKLKPQPFPLSLAQEQLLSDDDDLEPHRQQSATPPTRYGSTIMDTRIRTRSITEDLDDARPHKSPRFAIQDSSPRKQDEGRLPDSPRRKSTLPSASRLPQKTSSATRPPLSLVDSIIDISSSSGEEDVSSGRTTPNSAGRGSMNHEKSVTVIDLT